jgi:hypothetical protein
VTEVLYIIAEGIDILNVSSAYVDSLLAPLNKSMYFCLIKDAAYLPYSPDLMLFVTITLSDPMSDLARRDFPVPDAFPHVVQTLANR